MTNKKEIYYQYFKDKIVSKILPLEQKRINIVRKVILNSILFFAVGIIFAGLFIYNALHPVFTTLFLPVLLFLMYVFILKSIINVIVTCIDYQKLLLKLNNFDIIILFIWNGAVAQLARAFGSYPKGRGFESPSRYHWECY